MPSTRTPGITVDAQDHRTINKEYRGERIFLRLGAVAQEDAERRLLVELDRLELEIERRKHARALFSDCAKRFLLESKHKRTASDIAWHIRILLREVGDLEGRKVHDGTLRPFVEARLAEGVSATTVNRTLRPTSDHDATRVPRPPHPLTWEEQDRIFRRLPDHLARVALFAVNTGLRDANLCGLQWAWEVSIPELARSVFVIPAEEFKSRRPHVVVLNDAAWSIVQTQRGTHRRSSP
ncbi:MAG: hypothetical protein WCE62_08050 [Polyangiales bacterium]